MKRTAIRTLADVFEDELLMRAGAANGWRPSETRKRIRALYTRNTPQAVVKVINIAGTADGHHLIHYLSQDGALSVQMWDGTTLDTERDRDMLADAWSIDFNSDDGSGATDIAHVIFSMPKNNQREAMEATMHALLPALFPLHEYAWAVHTDTQHTHAHVAVKMISREREKSFRERRLQKGPHELEDWRMHYADVAERHGVVMDATPRRWRGLETSRAVSKAEYEIRKREAAGEPSTRTGLVRKAWGTTVRAKRAETHLAGELGRHIAGASTAADVARFDAERAMQERGEQEKTAYLRIAAAVEDMQARAVDAEVREQMAQLAAELTAHAEHSHAYETHRERLARRLQARTERERAHAAEREPPE